VNFKEVMATLKQMGTAQNVKIYKRHGASAKLFGVSFANLNKLQKKIKVNHELAKQLWETGNTDAMILSAKILDPNLVDHELAETWVQDISYYVIADIFSSVLSKSPIWKELMYEWIESPKEYVKQCGYDILASKISSERKRGVTSISNDEVEAILTRIKDEIHSSPNRAKHTMNNVIISIGSFIPEYTDLAINIASEIGKVEVDHGETSCKTPEAIPYIKKTRARIKQKT
jgi:3-methyladenine DNA glycosylase AlkD